MRNTSITEKIIPSIVNVILVLIFSLPVNFLQISALNKKLILIIMFFLYELVFIYANKGRDIGMILYSTYWKKEYSNLQLLIYNVLYTFSFATLFFSIFFPFDIFLLNILFLQLPCILFCGTTLHGALSGGIRSVRR